MRRRQIRKGRSRRGAVSVEFALVMPVFITVLVGIIQAANVVETQNDMSSALREGARLATMDRNGLLGEGQTTNDKIEQDIRNYLQSAGLPYETDDVNIIIASADDPDSTFNLDDPANNYELFEVRIEIPYDQVGWAPPGMEDFSLSSSVVFRNAKATLVN